MGFGLMDTLFPIIFVVMFCFVIGMFITTTVRGVSQWKTNNNSPKLSVEAKIVAKRTEVHHHHHGGETMHATSSTNCFITFEVESGDRMELSVSGSEYGMLAEGDNGKLTFQGTRYLSFERLY